MTDVELLTERHRLRAPQKDGEVLVEPAWPEVPVVVAANRELASAYTCDLLGTPLPQVARRARHDLLEQAIAYTSRYRAIPDVRVGVDATLLLAGHQPELFHPGVWYKNFALSRLGRRLDAQAVNLLIDNDTVSNASIRVPTGSVARPQTQMVAFDRTSPAIPYEERAILDSRAFATFSERTSSTVQPLVGDPLIGDFWDKAVGASRETGRLGEALAQARHLLEGDWGAETLEVPLSHVCRMSSFQRFAAHLISQLSEFREVHNDALYEYRRVNKIRSRTHPVPELGRQDEWLEAPFWLWTAENPQRRRVFGRPTANGWEITDLLNRYPLSMRSERDGSGAVEQLAAYERHGIKLRPRALITTMFSRLCLGDLFLHGIGGAKYDQLTDQIIRRFFGITPPRFMTISATVHLPIERKIPDVEELRRLKRLLRELEFHPERYAEGALATDLRDEKRRWIATHDRALAKRRHDEITRLNDLLQPLVSKQRRESVSHRDRLIGQLRNERILGSREFAFCLYPERTLKALLLDK